MKNSPIQGLYAITDPGLIPDAQLLDRILSAIKGGIDVLQYRNKQATAETQLKQAALLQEICRQHNICFIINDDPQLARKVHADGVHLGQQDSSLRNTREFLGASFLIGVSCYNQLDLALSAQHNGADYVAFGRFFSSRTKPNAVPAQRELIQQARQHIHLPLVAIGGINHTNIHYFSSSPPDAYAVIDGIFGTADIQANCQALLKHIN